MRNRFKLFLLILSFVMVCGIASSCSLLNQYRSSDEIRTPITQTSINSSTQRPTVNIKITQVTTSQNTPSVTRTPISSNSNSTTSSTSVIQIKNTPVWGPNQVYYPTIIITNRGEDNAFQLYNSNGTINRIYKLDPQIYQPLGAEHITNDCNLIALVAVSDGHKLVQINSEGNIEKEIFYLKFEDNLGNRRYIPKISSLGNYVAYAVFSGELYYDTADYQDIEVVSLDKLDRVIRITSHGGAWKEGGSWSPDGTQLAYTDYDDQGNLQVYITEINTWRKILLTANTDSKLRPGPISWSPQGNQMIAMVYDQNNNSELWLISIPQRKTDRLNLPPEVITIADQIQWSDDGSTLLLFIGDYTESGLEGLYWYDLNNNQLKHIFAEIEAAKINSHANSFSYPFPLAFNLSQIIINGNSSEWFLYDAKYDQLNPVTWLNTEKRETFLDVSVFKENIFTCNK